MPAPLAEGGQAKEVSDCGIVEELGSTELALSGRLIESSTDTRVKRVGEFIVGRRCRIQVRVVRNRITKDA